MGFQWLQDGLFIADTNYYGILHLDSTRTGWFSSRGIEEFGLHPVCRGPYGGNEFPEDLYRLALILHALSNSGRKLRAFAVPSEAGKGWLSWELVFSCHLRVRRSFMRTLLPVSLSLCFRGGTILFRAFSRNAVHLYVAFFKGLLSVCVCIYTHI